MLSYRKPYFSSYCGGGRKRSAPTYPYSRAMLRKYDVFELFILDGGAFFFTREHIGGVDTRRFVDAYVLRKGNRRPQVRELKTVLRLGPSGS